MTELPLSVIRTVEHELSRLTEILADVVGPQRSSSETGSSVQTAAPLLLQSLDVHFSADERSPSGGMLARGNRAD